MGRNARIKWQRREARWADKKEKEERMKRIAEKFDNIDTSKMTAEELHTFLKQMLDDPEGLDYMVGKCIKEKNQGLLQIISNYKQTGFLPALTVVEDSKEKPVEQQAQIVTES